MKRTLLSLILSISLISFSQAYNTQVIFNAHSGGKFILFVNGEKMNYRPVRHMSLNHLPAGRNNIRVRYWSGGASCDVWKTVFLKQGFETSFNIRTNRYGELRVVNTGSVLLPPVNRGPQWRGPGHGRPANGRFKQFMFELNQRRFDDRKFNFASRYLSRNDLTSRQLIRIVRQFSFDDTKVDFIVNAYPHIIDVQNFHLVYDELRFRTSVRAIKSQLGLLRNQHNRGPGDRIGPGNGSRNGDRIGPGNGRGNGGVSRGGSSRNGGRRGN